MYKSQAKPQDLGIGESAQVAKGKEGDLTSADGSGLSDLDVNQLWELFSSTRNNYGATSDELRYLRNELLDRHRQLVRFIAIRLHRTLPKSVELDDLISAGTFGLFDAINKFDPSRGVKFKTYCPPRIRGSILDQLRSEDWVPRLVRIKAGRIHNVLRTLTSDYGRQPTHTELASALDMGNAELSREVDAAHVRSMLSFSDKWEGRADEDSAEAYDFLEDERAKDPIADIEQRDTLDHITRTLTHKEKFIIEQYYISGHTMREIGEMLSLTESRVCQIHSNVMKQLKSQVDPLQMTLMS